MGLICGIEAEHAEQAAQFRHRLPGRRRDRLSRIQSQLIDNY
jgi:hypothetical protein